MSKETINKISRALHEQGLTYYEYMYLWGKKMGTAYVSDKHLLNEAIRQELTKNNYLKDDHLTPEAIALLEAVDVLKQFPDAMEINTEDRVNFDKWWNEYPLNDGHSHFFPRQGLRVNPSGCYTAYVEALNEGYTPQQLLDALRREVAVKKQNSSRRNELTFLPTSYNYLTKRHFIPWINTPDQPNRGGVNVNVQVYGQLA